MDNQAHVRMVASCLQRLDTIARLSVLPILRTLAIRCSSDHRLAKFCMWLAWRRIVLAISSMFPADVQTSHKILRVHSQHPVLHCPPHSFHAQYFPRKIICRTKRRLRLPLRTNRFHLSNVKDQHTLCNHGTSIIKAFVHYG